MSASPRTRSTHKARRRRHSRHLRLETLEHRMLLAGIQGTIFEDLDGDGLRGPEEPALPGVTVFLDQNGNGLLDTEEASTTTDDNGFYQFTELPTGEYTVAQLVPDNYLQTSPSSAASPSQFGRVLADFDLTEQGFSWSNAPGGLTWDPVGNLLYVRARGMGIFPIDPNTGQIPSDNTGFPLPTSSTLDITWDDATGTFWGVDPSADVIVQFRRSPSDPAQTEVLQQFPLVIPGIANPYPTGIAKDDVFDVLWVLDRDSETVYPIDPNSGAVLPGAFAAPGTGGSLYGLAFDGGHLWTNRRGDREGWNQTFEFGCNLHFALGCAV